MNKIVHNLLLLGFALSVMVLSTGCVAVALAGAGAGGYAYYKGELKSTESASLERVWNASKKAVAGLELNLTEENKDGLSAMLKARTADDKPVTIRLKRISSESTELRIRSGQIGDESRARQIQSAIQSRL